MIKTFKLTMLVVIAVSLMILMSGGPAWAGVIKVGYTAPFTGAAAEFGTNGWRGIQLGVEDVNKKGITVKGEKYTIEIVRYDSVCQPVDGAANTRKLIMEGKVVAILGDHCSSVCLAVAPLCDEFKIPGITIECAADKVTNPGFDYYFRMQPSMGLRTPLASPNIMKLMKPKKVGFLMVNDDYGHSFSDSFSKDLGKLGVQTVAMENFERGNTDMVVYLNKIRDAGADLVMYVGTTPEGAMILKQARELGMIPKINFMGSDEMAEQEMVNLAGAKACEGTYSLATYGSVPAEFTKRVKDKFNAPMHYAIIFGYDGVMALSKAIEIAQSLEGPKIRDGLLKVDFKGLQGPIKFETFDGFKNQGRYSPYIIRWVNGNRQVVEVK